LENPALFSGKVVDSFDISHEYLDICETLHPTKYKYIRIHLLQMLKARLDMYPDIRDSFGRTLTITQARCLIEQIRERVEMNAPQVMFEVVIREQRKERKANRTEELWDNS